MYVNSVKDIIICLKLEETHVLKQNPLKIVLPIKYSLHFANQRLNSSVINFDNAVTKSSDVQYQ